MHEKTIEAYLRKRVKAVGGLCIKFTSPSLIGVPDRIVVMPGGKVHFVELKSGRGRGVISTVQERRHRELRALGCEVYVLDSIDAVDYFMIVETPL